jgi:hypothetical protein
MEQRTSAQARELCEQVFTASLLLLYWYKCTHTEQRTSAQARELCEQVFTASLLLLYWYKCTHTEQRNSAQARELCEQVRYCFFTGTLLVQKYQY